MIEKQIIQYITSAIPIIHLKTIEYERVENIIERTFNKLNNEILPATGLSIIYSLKKWDFIRGITEFFDNNQTVNSITIDPVNAIDYIIKDINNPVIVVMRNFDMALDNSPMPTNPRLIEILLKFAKVGECENKHIVIIGNKNIPEELRSYTAVIDLPLPDLDSIIETLTKFISGLNITLEKQPIKDIAMICCGMDEKEILNSVSIAIRKNKGKYYIDTELLMEEKAKIVKKSGLLEWIRVKENIEDIGGLDNLKSWFTKIAKAFRNPNEAIKYGLPYMKGTLITGISGTGKTLTAKVISNLFGVPLFRLDIGRLYDSLVGSTERNTRELFKLIDAVSPAVILIDEIEKSLAGLESSSSSDAGVTARVVGSFLYYLQEKKTNSFFVCTANNVNMLPPELLRKGRFDELWYVPLPNRDELKQILKIHITKIGRDVNKFELDKILQNMNGFTGAEVESTIKQALYNSFFEDREVTTNDIIEVAKETIPLSITRKEELEALEKWAQNRARNASSMRSIRKSGTKNIIMN